MDIYIIGYAKGDIPQTQFWDKATFLTLARLCEDDIPLETSAFIWQENIQYMEQRQLVDNFIFICLFISLLYRKYMIYYEPLNSG